MIEAGFQKDGQFHNEKKTRPFFSPTTEHGRPQENI